MPAYMIVVAEITDRDRFINDYAPAAAQLVQQFGGRYVLRAPGAEVLEGGFGPNRSVAVSQWPDKAAARRFWESPEYQAVRRLREAACNAEVLLVEAPAESIA
ncbi:MAG: DUF1330 domain-containing protein [Chromatiales bacterium]|nr:DUF1330 domain-containing protein [Chromatiales bacterium]